MFYNTITKTYSTEAEIRKANPSVLFASPFVPPAPYVVVFPTPAPTYDRITQYARELAPTKDEHGNYVQTWLVDQLSEEDANAALALSVEAFKEMVVGNVQQRLDDFAQTANYDNVNSMSKYQNITDEEISELEPVIAAMVTKFRAEARYLTLMTAATWAKLYAILNEVTEGTRIAPTTYEEIEAELPTLTWPV